MFPLGIPRPGSASSSSAEPWLGAQFLWHLDSVLNRVECWYLLYGACGDLNSSKLAKTIGFRNAWSLPSRECCPPAVRWLNLTTSSVAGKKQPDLR